VAAIPKDERIEIMSTSKPRILFCNCSYAQVVPREVKETVLKNLCQSGLAFEAVGDLCEMSARRDPSLKRLAAGDSLKIAACYPRAVKWLFAAANAPLNAGATEVLNMRVESGADLLRTLLNGEMQPNLPEGKVTAADPQELPDTAGSAGNL
jgi:hypothetical protein